MSCSTAASWPVNCGSRLGSLCSDVTSGRQPYLRRPSAPRSLRTTASGPQPQDHSPRTTAPGPQPQDHSPRTTAPGPRPRHLPRHVECLPFYVLFNLCTGNVCFSMPLRQPLSFQFCSAVVTVPEDCTATAGGLY